MKMDSHSKGLEMKKQKNAEIGIEKEVDEAKREFMIKYGKYAATAPLGMYLLMGPGASKAQASGSCRHRHRRKSRRNRQHHRP